MKDIIKRITLKGWLAGLVLLCTEALMYEISDRLSILTGTIHHAVSTAVPLDARIPLIRIFVVIYVFSFVFWVMGSAAVTLTKKENYINFAIAMLASYIIGTVIFIHWPTCMDRAATGLLDMVGQPGLLNFVLRTVYAFDGGARAYNLAPSFHCMISLMCYLGIHKQPELPRWYRVYSLVMVLLICLSTVFTKQHYLVDVPAGLALAFVCWFAVRKLDPARRILLRRAEKPAKKEK